jgi:hypothetical protein
LSIVKIRLWLPGRFVSPGSAAVSKKCCPLREPRVRILLPPAVSQERTLRDIALGLSVLGMFFGVMPSFNPQPVFFVPFLNRQFGIAVEAVVIGANLRFDPARFVA